MKEVYNGLQRQHKLTKLNASTGYTVLLAAVNSVGKRYVKEKLKRPALKIDTTSGNQKGNKVKLIFNTFITEGNVFTGVCLSPGGGRLGLPQPLVPGLFYGGTP